MAIPKVGRLWLGALALFAFGVPALAQEFPKMDETWTVSVHGQTIQVNPDGSFRVPNVSSADQFGPGGPGTRPDFVSDEYLRVIGVSTAGGSTRYAYSDVFRLARGQRISVGQMTISDTAPPFPQSVRTSVDDNVLNSAGQTTMVRVLGTLLDGSTLDVSGSAAGTTYRTSNSNILAVNSEGLATAMGDGFAFVTATNEGAASVASVLVALGDPLTEVIGFVQFDDGTPVADATVSVSGQAGTALSGADGRFSISDVATTLGDIRLRARASGSLGSLFGSSDALTPVPAGLTDGGVIQVSPSAALNLGMAGDDNTNSVVVFETVGDTILGIVPLVGAGSIVGDCSITADGTLGFISDFNFRVWVVDLTQQPPVLAAGINPIIISNNSEDTVVTMDDRFLIVCDGSNRQPVSVIDIASRLEVSTFSAGTNGCNSVELCPDGSVLVTSFSQEVRRLILDGAGNLTDSGVLLTLPSSAINTACEPSGQSAAAALQSSSVASFLLPSLQMVDSRPLSGGFGIGTVFNPAGDRLYVRSTGGFVDAFAFDPATAQLGASPIFSISVTTATAYFGIDQMAMHPDGSRLYVPEGNVLNIYSPDDGSLIGTISDPSSSALTGVCIR